MEEQSTEINLTKRGDGVSEANPQPAVIGKPTTAVPLEGDNDGAELREKLAVKRQKIELQSDRSHESTEQEQASETVTTLNNEPQSKIISRDSYTSLLEYVEDEIWARAEEQWRYPTTAGFAQEAVDLGLAESTKQAKKDIKELFLRSEFSVRRVITRFLSRYAKEEGGGAINVEHAVAAILKEHGGAITLEVARREIRLASGLEDVNDSESDDDDGSVINEQEEEQRELDETTKSVLAKLISNDHLRALAKKAGLDVARVSRVKGLEPEMILSLVEELDHAESYQGDAKVRRNLLRKIEKKSRSVAPLSYQLTKYPSKATRDMLDLAMVAIASRLSLPVGVTCTEAGISNKGLFTIQHPSAAARFRPFLSFPTKKLAWFSTSSVGAAFVLQHGHPFPGMDREIILHGNRKNRTMDGGFKEAKVWIVFELAVDLKHCGIEKFIDKESDLLEPDSDLRTQVEAQVVGSFFEPDDRVHVYDVDSMRPVMMMIA